MLYIYLLISFIILFVCILFYFLNNANNEPYVIVSITTSPRRILLMEPVINSILNQTYPPDLIRINIPYKFKRNGEKYIIPSFLKNNPKIKIYRYEEDLGPIMKVLPTIIDHKNDDNTIIIYTDDDIIMLPNMIETHLDKINEDSSNVYCFSGIYYPEGKWININIEGFIDIPEGYMSVAFKSNILKDKSCIYEYYEKLKHDKDCFQSDDFIIGNYFSMNKIKKYQIFNKDLNRHIWWKNYRNVLSYGVDEDGLQHLNEGGHEQTYKRIYNKLKEINYLFL